MAGASSGMSHPRNGPEYGVPDASTLLPPNLPHHRPRPHPHPHPRPPPMAPNRCAPPPPTAASSEDTSSVPGSDDWVE
uniref:Uncharacterized protein n=1 Tax=Oryza rufipogon TaxID=4529 RepID=A0A0E0R480_ORYRU